MLYEPKILAFEETNNPTTFVCKLGELKLFCNLENLSTEPTKAICLDGNPVTTNTYLKLPASLTMSKIGKNRYLLSASKQRFDMFVAKCPSGTDITIAKVSLDANYSAKYDIFYHESEKFSIVGILLNTDIAVNRPIVPVHEVTLIEKTDNVGSHRHLSVPLILAKELESNRESIISALDGDIERPDIEYPYNGSVNIKEVEHVHASPFYPITPNIVHRRTIWQIASDRAFLNIVTEVDSDQFLTDIMISEFGVETNTEYYLRCKFVSDEYESLWSRVTKFTTVMSKIETPSITRPANWETYISGKSTIRSSFYRPIFHNEPHLSTDWEIATDTEFNNVVLQRLEDNVDLVEIGTIKLLGLTPNTTYYVRCRYHSTTYTSEWSNLTQFTTEKVFEFEETEKIVPDDNNINDYFGSSSDVSEDGNVLAIGAYGDDDNGNLSGSVRIYRWDADTSSYRLDQFIAGDNGSYAGFHLRLVDNGKTLFIGEYKNSGASGAILLYKWSSEFSRFVKLQTIEADDKRINTGFGVHFDLSPDNRTLVVGAYADDVSNTDSGSAYVLEEDQDGMYRQVQKILPPTPYYQGYFGRTVTISDDKTKIIVGEFRSDISGDNCGALHYYKLNNGSYEHAQTILPNDIVANDYFGFSSSLSSDGRVLVTGAYNSSKKVSRSGCGYVFTYNDVTEQFEYAQSLLPGDLGSSDYLGKFAFISADANVILVSAYYGRNEGIRCGVVYVYEWDSSLNVYVEKQKIAPSDGASYDYFGVTFSTTSNCEMLVMNSHFDDDTGSNSGSVYIFK